MSKFLERVFDSFPPHHRSVDEDHQAKCGSQLLFRNKNGISFGRQRWDQSFPTIPKQSSDQGLEKSGYVAAKTYYEKYRGTRGFSPGEESILCI